ncbi:cell wall protein DAN4-like [Vanessa atalanta]|uniref:cell wall protein DAN4-like n=1 Tax=Vanessa atalanta TaxID=42275 RepID=UPI001FCD7FE8|nr:cell wall protein DAN4-like [Vanessa atalanta]
MAYLRKFSIVFCLLLISIISGTESNKDTKIAFPIFDVTRLCSDRLYFARSRKIICLLCKGFDPSCLQYSTSTTTSSTTTPTTTTNTTTTATTPTINTTTTEATPASE